MENVETDAMPDGGPAWDWAEGGLALEALGPGRGLQNACRKIYPAGTCRLVFCLEGRMTLGTLSADAPEESRLASDQAALVYYPHRCLALDRADADSVRCLILHLNVCRLSAFLGNGGLEAVLKTAVAESRPLALVQPLGEAALHTLDKVATAMETGRGPSLLMVMYLVELAWRFAGGPDPTEVAGVCAADRRALQRVRCILEENLSRPPSLKALACRAGMSVSKLKLLFPRACGVPPFAYLRRLRLEKARSLLMYSSMNVTEVAMEVGYTSLSHFSRAFTECYGVAPSRLRQAFPVSEAAAGRRAAE